MVVAEVGEADAHAGVAGLALVACALERGVVFWRGVDPDDLALALDARVGIGLILFDVRDDDMPFTLAESWLGGVKRSERRVPGGSGRSVRTKMPIALMSVMYANRNVSAAR